jgi:hypothetical protein
MYWECATRNPVRMAAASPERQLPRDMFRSLSPPVNALGYRATALLVALSVMLLYPPACAGEPPLQDCSTELQLVRAQGAVLNMASASTKNGVEPDSGC